MVWTGLNCLNGGKFDCAPRMAKVVPIVDASNSHLWVLQALDQINDVKANGRVPCYTKVKPFWGLMELAQIARLGNPATPLRSCDFCEF